MDRLFLTVLNMSLTGAFVIAAVILARLPLKKAPKIISYCLWAVVGFRLVCPFAIESSFSLIPFKAEQVTQDELASEAEISFLEAVVHSMQLPGDDTYVPIRNPGLVDIDSAPFNGIPMRYLFGYEAYTILLSYLWPIGVAAMLLYGLVSYALLKRRTRTAIRTEGNLYETDNIPSPFVLGIMKPKIYLPLSLADDEREYILLHERTHIRRHDHIVKCAAYFILCLHWFNPLAWVAFLLMGVDMEMSCDERVLKDLGGETKHDYSRSLLSLATQRRMIGGSPLAFGEGGVKERVKNVLHFRKPSRVIVAVAVTLVAVLSVGFAVNRASHPTPPTPQQAFQNFSNIVSYDSKALYLTIPKDIPSGYKLYIHVSGRRKMDDGAMSFHAFEEESDNYSWELGKTYTYEIARDDLLEGLVVIGLVKNGESEVMYEYQVDFLGTAPQTSAYEPQKWVDYYRDTELPWTSTYDLMLDEFSGVLFSWTSDKVTAMDSNGVKGLFTGMPVWSVYLADLNGDGLPELCATVSMGSGIVDTRVIVYDYANDKGYDLSDRMYYNYALSLEDGQLVVTQTGFLAHSGRTVTGSMSIVDGKLVLYGIDRTRPEPEPKETAPSVGNVSPTDIVRQELLNDGCKIEYVFLMAQGRRKSLQSVDNGELATVYASYTEGEYGDAIYCMCYDFERATTDSQWTHSEPSFWEGIAVDVAAYAARSYYAEQNGVDYEDVALSWAYQEDIEALYPDVVRSHFAAFYIGPSGGETTLIVLTSPDGQSRWKVVGYDGI